MGGVLACLRGWHPALALAELKALLPETTTTATAVDRWWWLEGEQASQRHDVLGMSSGLQCFLKDAVVTSTDGLLPADWLEGMRTSLLAHPVSGSVAVRAGKQGGKIPSWSLSSLAGELGGLLNDMGCTIDLDTPDHVLALIGDGPSASLACGWMEGDGQAAFSSGQRRAGERPFFKPVSLDPRLARLAVNLAAGPANRGPVVDPMTGTGGFLIEASLSGRACMGLDIHSEMVVGATMNLAWAHDDDVPSESSVKRGDATRLEDVLPNAWLGKVAGFVLDPPYGRNSHGSMESDQLLEAAMTSAHAVACSDAGFVLILPIHPITPHPMESLPLDSGIELLNGKWKELLTMVERCGWKPVSVHAERVHRSLSRLILHAKYVPRD